MQNMHDRSKMNFGLNSDDEMLNYRPSQLYGYELYERALKQPLMGRLERFDLDIPDLIEGVVFSLADDFWGPSQEIVVNRATEWGELNNLNAAVIEEWLNNNHESNRWLSCWTRDQVSTVICTIAESHDLWNKFSIIADAYQLYHWGIDNLED